MDIEDKPILRNNYGGVNKGRRFVIIHGNSASAESTLNWFNNPDAKVSYHYLITLNGDIWRFLHEYERAWHAGKSEWDGYTNLNDWSVGICIESNEGVNNQITNEQYSRLIELVNDIRYRYNIPSGHVLGHKEVSPGRKLDPVHLDMDMFRKDLDSTKNKPPEYFDTVVLHGVTNFEIVNDAVVIRGKAIKTERNNKLDVRFL